jgi:hypothetical protein
VVIRHGLFRQIVGVSAALGGISLLLFHVNEVGITAKAVFHNLFQPQAEAAPSASPHSLGESIPLPARVLDEFLAVSFQAAIYAHQRQRDRGYDLIVSQRDRAEVRHQDGERDAALLVYLYERALSAYKRRFPPTFAGEPTGRSKRKSARRV